MAGDQSQINLTGCRFGAWLVLRRSTTKRKGRTLWLCLCACGTRADVSSYDLRKGKSAQCVTCKCKAASAARYRR